VDTLAAMGSTDIHQALLDTLAVADSERVTYLIFMTDGLPTAGESGAKKSLPMWLCPPKRICACSRLVWGTT
jgi:Ca-activated chloride channel family protein